MPATVPMVITGLLSGGALGYVLQRSGLCFHAMFASAWQRDTTLLRGWLLGVGVGSVGLSLIYLVSSYDLNRGLAFRPVQNIVGGLVIGFGMVVARSCASGLFYKLGAGMLGASVGIIGWVVGELAATHVHLGGPTVLPGGSDATITGLLGVPRLLGSLVLLVVVVAVCRRLSRGRPLVPADQDRSMPGSRWAWPRTGLALGAVLILGWVLAGAGGVGFGPSTVGASAGIQSGHPNWWLVAFLVGLVPGAHVAARVAGDWRPRAELPVRYLKLVAGGFLLGAGGWVAGGCNLGHGLSGTAQLNVSSWVVVVAMAVGVGVSRGLVRALVRPDVRAAS